MELSEIRDTPMFRGLSEEETACALSVLQSAQRRYRKGAVLMHAGGRAECMGLVLSGSVTIESCDLWGNRAILSHVGSGQFFAESYALLPDEPMLVDVTANEDCTVLFLRPGPLIRQEVRTPWASKLTANLLLISARKNLHLSARSFHTAPKTIRARVLSYLNAVSLQTGHREFEIPFDRQQMADYLNVERTALSKELGRMKREGFFTCRKNRFVLLRDDLGEI